MQCSVNTLVANAAHLPGCVDHDRLAGQL